MYKLFLLMVALLVFSGCNGEPTASVWTEVYTPQVQTIPTPHVPPLEHVAIYAQLEESEELPEEYTPQPVAQNVQKIIALTFDDGPARYTNQILDLLERYGGRATFCVLGYRVQPWSEVVLRTAQLGSEVIGHSWTHRNMTNLTEDEIRREILDTSEAITNVLGASPTIFRAPFGQVNELVEEIATELGYSMLHWSIDPRDWENRNADHIHNYIMEHATHGSIVLLHDIHGTTAEAMVRTIPELIAQGFQLVTATEVLEYVYGGLTPGELHRGIHPQEEPEMELTDE